MKKYILVVEQDPELKERFQSAFLQSGYHVKVTDRTTEVLDLMGDGEGFARPFDLVIVDISEKAHRRLMADMLDRNASLPVFTVKDAADKALIIEMLNQKRTDLLERFIDAYPKTSDNQRFGYKNVF